MTNLLPTLVLSFVIGSVSAYLVSKFGFRLGLSDVPNQRSAHLNPIPKGGGIGIPVAVGLTVFLSLNRDHYFIGLAVLLSAISLVNDKVELPVGFRLLIEFSCGLILIIVFRPDLIPSMNHNYGKLAATLVVALAVIYIVASTNFYNFMDGINGLAGFEAVISFLFLGFFSVSMRNSMDTLPIIFSLMAASTGFLLFNFPRATVFMGDVGSIFIGFLFAALVVYLSSNIKEFLLLTIFQGVFYIDGTSTILLRLIKGENVLRAHNTHLYQKLVHRLGWSHSKVTLFFALTQIFVGILGLIVFQGGVLVLVIFWAFLFMLYWLILMRSGLVNA